MSDKRKKQKFAEKRAAKKLQEDRKRREQAEKEGRLINGVEVPVGAVIADQSQQVPKHPFEPPVLFYKDVAFQCVDCGSKEVWTAERQKWYYEVAKGSLYGKAIRCRNCRNKRRDINQLRQPQSSSENNSESQE